MNITVNGNNNTISTIIDLSGITTLGELKNALPSTGNGRVPGINQLRKKANMLLRRETGSGIIEIYDNGFFTFEECGRPTVFGVDRCERPETYSYSGKKESGMENQDFSPYPWDIILESAGCARLAHNADSRDEYQSEISMDAPESENNIQLSVRPEHEIREEEEIDQERRRKKSEGVKKEYDAYCLQDVRTERDIRHRLETFPLPDSEWDYYHMDQRINDRGVLIDRKLVEQAITCDLMMSEEMTRRAYELTGLDNPNSVSQLKGWLEERGIEVDSLGKKNVSTLIRDLDKHSIDGEAQEMMKLRLQMAKSSVKKYQAADRCICKDGRAHGLFQFSGANRTQRWSGRLIQLQNLPQNHINTLDEARELLKMGAFDMLEVVYGNTPDILSQLLRTMLIPKPGCIFIVCDFSAIEARVLAWLAGETWRLDAFRRGEDIYCASASQMFGVPVVKHGINGELRQKGKVAELACGYGGASGALISMGALDMGLKEQELPDIIESWRTANPKIVQFWWDVENAAMETVKDHQDRTVGKIGFQFSANTLWLVLPSRRRLAYIKPKLMPNRFGRMAITFEGLNAANKWARGETYAGRLVENCTQSTARDLLAEAMWRVEKRGLDIVAHVHDEMILEVPEGSVTVEKVSSIMNEVPAWAEGMPISSSGYWGRYYFKD